MSRPAANRRALRAARASAGVLLALLILAGCATAPAPEPEPRAAPEATVDPALEQAFEAGLAQLRGEDFAAAITTFQGIIEENDALAAVHANLGIALARGGDPEAGRAALERAAELAPQQPVVLNQLGVLYRRAGRFQDAAEAYRKALAADPDYADAHVNLGMLCELYIHDLECALQHYRRYQDLASEADPEVELWIADVTRRLPQP